MCSDWVACMHPWMPIGKRLDWKKNYSAQIPVSELTFTCVIHWDNKLLPTNYKLAYFMTWAEHVKRMTNREQELSVWTQTQFLQSEHLLHAYQCMPLTKSQQNFVIENIYKLVITVQGSSTYCILPHCHMYMFTINLTVSWME